MTPVVVPMVAGLGPPEIILIIIVVMLLFGAKKLPELARGSGRALRIFKAETKGLMDDDDEPKDPSDAGKDKYKTPEQREIDAQHQRDAAQRIETQRQAETRPDTER
jgi:sec-independent protein translocase protein TatA